MNVAYSDGHASAVHIPESDYRRADHCWDYGGDDFAFLFFKALDRGDFSQVRQAYPEN